MRISGTDLASIKENLVTKCDNIRFKMEAGANMVSFVKILTKYTLPIY